MQEGVYRHVNGRLITHAEEIAFYGGNAKEKGIITAAFHDLVALVRRSQQVCVSALKYICMRKLIAQLLWCIASSF
jgi:ABC-type uncharacterized transport system fused permease/ATPase subunit